VNSLCVCRCNYLTCLIDMLKSWNTLKPYCKDQSPKAIIGTTCTVVLGASLEARYCVISHRDWVYVHQPHTHTHSLSLSKSHSGFVIHDLHSTCRSTPNRCHPMRRKHTRKYLSMAANCTTSISYRSSRHLDCWYRVFRVDGGKMHSAIWALRAVRFRSATCSTHT
jgi:hypothetical protein